MTDRPSEEPKEVDVQKAIDAFVDTSDLAESYGINEKSFLRRLDLKLLPPLSFLYLLSFLDRSNVGNARVEGLTTDLHMTGNEYLTGLTTFFIGYVLLEVPAQMILKLWTPRMWLPTIVIAWSAKSARLIGKVLTVRKGYRCDAVGCGAEQRRVPRREVLAWCDRMRSIPGKLT
jgi:hypothetical protein